MFGMITYRDARSNDSTFGKALGRSLRTACKVLAVQLAMGHGGVDLRDTDAVNGVTGVKPLAEQLDEYRNLVNRELE